LVTALLGIVRARSGKGNVQIIPMALILEKALE